MHGSCIYVRVPIVCAVIIFFNAFRSTHNVASLRARLVEAQTSTLPSAVGDSNVYHGHGGLGNHTHHSSVSTIW